MGASLILTQMIPWHDPAMVAQCLRDLPGLVWLDSAMIHPVLGRYSYIAADPFDLYRVAPPTDPAQDPLRQLCRQLAQWQTDKIEGLPPFQGGAVGYIGYEYAGWLEQVPRPPGGAGDDICFGFYDLVLAWDHEQQQSFLFSTGWPETDPARRAARAAARRDFFLGRLDKIQPLCAPPAAAMPRLDWHSNFDRAAFMAAVRRVQDYILAGDIYQANLTRRMLADWPADYDPFDVWLALRQHNPAPFAAWLDLPGIQIASSSPERFVRIHDRNAETRPIKGTIRRNDRPDEDPDEDRRRADLLVASEKDRAENIMIVDLLRNDFSRTCWPDSVQVPVLCGLESYAGLHHLVSVVTGVLDPACDAADLVAGCFPGGSITGAPKIRAMEIIAEIEQIPRGVYCGCIGWMAFHGDLDLNIAIRTLVFQDNKISFHAGGGITALSDPAAEFDEIMTKSARILRVFEDAP